MKEKNRVNFFFGALKDDSDLINISKLNSNSNPIISYRDQIS